MATHKVKLVADPGVFRGLAKQNMLFHQCIGELVDNSIAACPPDVSFTVDIIFDRQEDDIVDVYVTDQSGGMDLDELGDALQLGRLPTGDQHRLHEHGFGLKNALTTLTKNELPWTIWTRKAGSRNVLSVSGPFGPEMEIDDDATFPDKDFLTADISTIVYFRTRIDYVRTVQGRGAPTRDLEKLRIWLMEHLGVFYRGYLDINEKTGVPYGSIFVAVGKDRKRVPRIPVPFASVTTVYIDVEINGKVHNLMLNVGTLDEVKRESLVGGEKAKYYYQGNIQTQGIDIQLGKRVIATRQLETIWKKENGDPLTRHNDFNDFVGELIIPELPRGVLTTVNNKTDFNLDDPNWERVFNAINDKYQPRRGERSLTEKSLREKWASMLKGTNPEDTISQEVSVWPASVKIDVYREKPTGEIIIYELKVGSAKPLDIYQLLMYWDGLELEGKTVKEGVLLVGEYSPRIEQMISDINTKLIRISDRENRTYNIRIELYKEKGIT